MRKTIAFAALALLFLPLNAMDVREGRIRLAVNEETGKFTVSWLKNIDKTTYVPLIFDQDPRTTQIVLSVDGKTWKLGETADFKVKVARTDQGVEIEYRSSSCVFRLRMSFIRSKNAPLSDGVKAEFEMENISEKDLSMGLKFIVDTYLGENSRQHFYTQARTKVQDEYSVKGDFKDAYWVSPGETGVALQFMMDAEGVTKPDMAAFANWKRLQDSTWNFDSVSGRSFDLLPYSINDSAAAMWYEPVQVLRAQKRVVTAAFGNYSDNAFALSSQTQAPSQDSLFNSTVLKANSPEEKMLSVQTDMLALKDLIDQIDRKLSQGGTVTDDELAVYWQILERLRKRKESY